MEELSMNAKLMRWEGALFAFFLLTLPLQVRTHLISFGGGEWMSAWLWASDIALFALLGVFLIQRPRISTFAPLALALFFLPSVLANPGLLTGWGLWKVIEGLLLFSYVRSRYAFICEQLRKPLWAAVASSGLVASALLGVAQFVTQGDLGLQYLDESPLSAEGAGVAKFFVEGAKIIRAYGLTPHPNILGALLGAAVLLTFSIVVARLAKPRAIRDIFPLAGLFLFMLTLLLTFSRSAWVALLVGLFVFLFLLIGLKSLRQEHFSRAYKAAIFLFTVVIILGAGFSSFIFPRLTSNIATDQALTLRSFYAEQAVEIIHTDPLLGVGPGGFVETLTEKNAKAPQWSMQPVHNVVLLLIAELGVPAALLLIAIFVTTITDGVAMIRQAIRPRQSIALAFGLALVSMFIIQSLGDHYLWTSQQGMLLFWLGLGVLCGQSGSAPQQEFEN